ncbi:hypothetical protein EAX61_01080 [Dokdonia sinensis]|uniref:Curlin associated repeat-containing protein n=2 Tax=Dokdonia sinensis TaxID=2479847 RepID=A0A3M0GGE7_9FLAO|nr:hypothetical protein EAX61_01080 [Dokdonia sinensis]
MIKIFMMVNMFLICSAVKAQTYIETETDEEQAVDASSSNGSPLSVNQIDLINLGFDLSPNPINQTLVGNKIFLTQIGEGNLLAVATQTNASEINLRQNGNENFANLQYRAKTAYTDIEQNGNRNTVFDLVNRPQLDVSLELQQNGDGLNFQRIGANNLTKSLKFNQGASTPTLIVRSVN